MVNFGIFTKVTVSSFRVGRRMASSRPDSRGYRRSVMHRHCPSRSCRVAPPKRLSGAGGTLKLLVRRARVSFVSSGTMVHPLEREERVHCAQRGDIRGDDSHLGAARPVDDSVGNEGAPLPHHGGSRNLTRVDEPWRPEVAARERVGARAPHARPRGRSRPRSPGIPACSRRRGSRRGRWLARALRRARSSARDGRREA